MAYGRAKIFTIFALFGFFIGTVAYFIFNWFVTNDLLRVTSISIIDVIISPWFISGVVGALLAIAILTVLAHLSVEE